MTFKYCIIHSTAIFKKIDSYEILPWQKYVKFKFNLHVFFKKYVQVNLSFYLNRH